MFWLLSAREVPTAVTRRTSPQKVSTALCLWGRFVFLFVPRRVLGAVPCHYSPLFLPFIFSGLRKHQKNCARLFLSDPRGLSRVTKRGACAREGTTSVFWEPLPCFFVYPPSGLVLSIRRVNKVHCSVWHKGGMTALFAAMKHIGQTAQQGTAPERGEAIGMSRWYSGCKFLSLVPRVRPTPTHPASQPPGLVTVIGGSPLENDGVGLGVAIFADTRKFSKK